MPITEILMIAGFLLAAYAVVANDSIQTLGTFIASNAQRPWWQLWLFASSILVAVLLYGWWVNGGDPAYGRLEKFPPPSGGVSIIHVLAPFTLLLLTRFGVPVSTTFLVLSVFGPGNIQSMLVKSLIGYAVAFVVAIIVYRFLVTRVTAYFHRTRDQQAPLYWVAIQWLSTAFLWSQWLIQDLANIFVFAPREIGALWLGLALLALVSMQGVIFFQQGGSIQHIVTSKTMTYDIRAASIIDFIYGVILMVFKEWSNMPMSTTWVFLGLLAGREIAMSLQLKTNTLATTGRLISMDAGKAFIGLVVSVFIAYMAIWFGLN
jgi:hypothetical protein